jgi:hypothetical protein
MNLAAPNLFNPAAFLAKAGFGRRIGRNYANARVFQTRQDL